MSYRIKEIFAAIHRPLNEGRRVLALSRAEAERLPVLPGIAMISIVGAGASQAKLPAYEYLLRLTFSDVDFMSNDLTDRAQKKLAHAMTKEQAIEVHEFIQALPASVRTVIVHCGAGVSRSCGVASALHAIYGFEVETERLAGANQSVKKLLIDIAKTMGH